MLPIIRRLGALPLLIIGSDHCPSFIEFGTAFLLSCMHKGWEPPNFQHLILNFLVVSYDIDAPLSEKQETLHSGLQLCVVCGHNWITLQLPVSRGLRSHQP